jgi:hypothetical protein
VTRASQVAYFNSMQIPLALIERINSTEPRRMHVLNSGELKRYGLH